jgi:hypothetical protein
MAQAFMAVERQMAFSGFEIPLFGYRTKQQNQIKPAKFRN